METISGQESITAAGIETNYIVVGTLHGYVHIINFSGRLVRSTHLFPGRPVRSLSLDCDSVSGQLHVLRSD